MTFFTTVICADASQTAVLQGKIRRFARDYYTTLRMEFSMKFLHLSDLHIGKRVNEFSMLEDQRYILTKILNIADDEMPDGVIIAGDVYDKSVPSAEAVQLYDDFLYKLSKKNVEIFIISGNHDSPERISFGSRLMKDNIHIAPVYNGDVKPVTLHKNDETIRIYLLPFIKPANVRRYFPDEKIESYTDALSVAVKHMNIDTDECNILVTHQFVTGATRSDSEEISIGGSDNVDAAVFEDFDYVALGHIHKPQSAGSSHIRYCGTPLKYSFSEANHKKSVSVIDISKGKFDLKTIDLIPLRDLREIKGTYMDITSLDNYKDTNTDDYMHITLTDEEDIPDAIGKLRVIYPNIMKLDYDNTRTRNHNVIMATENIEQKNPLELFEEFFEKQNNQPMSETQRKFAKELMEDIWRIV